MTKKRRTYQPRIVGGQVMMPADLERLHKYMPDIEHIDHISDEMRAVVESEWPELSQRSTRQHSGCSDGGRWSGYRDCCSKLFPVKLSVVLQQHRNGHCGLGMPWKAISWWALGIVAFALLLYSSQPFHSCLQEADKYYRGNTSQEDVLVVLRTFKSCIGIYILEKNAVITALATIAIAAFTATIWAINKRQWRHGRHVE